MKATIKLLTIEINNTNFRKTIFDLTWAFSARFTGHNFNELLRSVFNDKNIEDLWLPYFCITTDIT
jgi:lysophospholipid hydrolase